MPAFDYSPEQVEAKRKQIQLLINLADDATTPENEAALARERAEKIMAKFRIEESELIAAHPEFAITPGHRSWPICPSNSPYVQTYYEMMYVIADHVGVRMHYKWQTFDGNRSLMAHVVGYETDLWFAESLFNSARLTFGSRMEPKVNSAESDSDNVYRLRQAGVERIRIAEMMGWGTKGSATAKVTKLYKQACEARGEDAALTGRGVSVKAFRETYAEDFANTLRSRLRLARLSAVDVETGGALVLANRGEKVDEAFYKIFPGLRPSESAGKDLADMTPAERKRAERERDRDARRWAREQDKRDARRYSPAGQMGAHAGRAAAQTVEIARTASKGKVNPGDSTGKREIG